jgi:hypothetical protein
VKRRTLLGALGAGLSGLGGCSGIIDGERTPTLTPVDVPPPATPTATAPQYSDDESCAGPDSEYLLGHPPFDDIPPSPGQFDDVGCPSFPWAAETICYHQVAQAGGAVETPVVLVGGRTVDVDDTGAAAVEFVLLNRSATSVRIQPGAWSLLEPDGMGGWQSRIAGTPTCTRTLVERGIHYWQFGLGTSVTDSRVNVTATALSVPPAGTYLVAVPVVLADGRDVACVAPFEVRRVAESDTSTDTPADFYTDPNATVTPSPTAEEL